MIKIALDRGLFIFGLDAENIRRLMDKKPIYVDLNALGGTGGFVIMAAETLTEVAADIKADIGIEIPVEVIDKLGG